MGAARRRVTTVISLTLKSVGEVGLNLREASGNPTVLIGNGSPSLGNGPSPSEYTGLLLLCKSWERAVAIWGRVAVKLIISCLIPNSILTSDLSFLFGLEVSIFCLVSSFCVSSSSESLTFEHSFN